MGKFNKPVSYESSIEDFCPLMICFGSYVDETVKIKHKMWECSTDLQ